MAEAATLDVAIIGGGPAGLAAALALSRRGLSNIAILEREAEAGGVPRHCGHPPFGWQEYRRILTGPAYARRLVSEVRSARISLRTGTTVTALGADGVLSIADAGGLSSLAARRVILATGAREAPRAARLIAGARPLGVINTGALQAMIYLENRVPFRRPVVVGTELVSYSALLTCMKAGIHPVAMIEEAPRPIAHPACGLFPWLRGIALCYGTRIEAVEGRERVEAVRLRDHAGHERRIACDGVLLTGCFTPESALARMGPLALDPHTGGPAIDGFGRTSDAACFAAGNGLRPIETAGWCRQEGHFVGEAVADDLAGRLPAPSDTIAVAATEPVRYVVPQRLSQPLACNRLPALQLRVARPVRGMLRVVDDERRPLWERRASLLPERRVLIPLAALDLRRSTASLTVLCDEESR